LTILARIEVVPRRHAYAARDIEGGCAGCALKTAVRDVDAVRTRGEIEVCHFRELVIDFAYAAFQLGDLSALGALVEVRAARETQTPGVVHKLRRTALHRNDVVIILVEWTHGQTIVGLANSAPRADVVFADPVQLFASS
jgi:hypothetical protein